VKLTAKILIVVTVCTAFYAPTTNPQVEPSREYVYKAGFLCKFLLFTRWPEDVFADSNTEITIGVLGKNPFGDAFEPVIGEEFNGRPLFVKFFGQDTPAETLRECHLLFIVPTQDRTDMRRTLTSLEGSHVLTVSDSEDFVEDGGMIGFVQTRDRIGFEIHKSAASKAGVNFSSKLLRVATRVVEADDD